MVGCPCPVESRMTKRVVFYCSTTTNRSIGFNSFIKSWTTSAVSITVNGWNSTLQAAWYIRRVRIRSTWYGFCELNLRYDYYSGLDKISFSRVLCFILMKDIGIEEQYVRTCSTRPCTTLVGCVCPVESRMTKRVVFYCLTTMNRSTVLNSFKKSWKTSAVRTTVNGWNSTLQAAWYIRRVRRIRQ